MEWFRFPIDVKLLNLTVEFSGGAEQKWRNILQGLERVAKVSPEVAKEVIKAAIEQNKCHEYEFDVFLGLRFGWERKRVHLI